MQGAPVRVPKDTTKGAPVGSTKDTPKTYSEKHPQDTTKEALQTALWTRGRAAAPLSNQTYQGHYLRHSQDKVSSSEQNAYHRQGDLMLFPG